MSAVLPPAADGSAASHDSPATPTGRTGPNRSTAPSTRASIVGALPADKLTQLVKGIPTDKLITVVSGLDDKTLT